MNEEKDLQLVAKLDILSPCKIQKQQIDSEKLTFKNIECFGEITYILLKLFVHNAVW